jgi:hypothetical protein
MRVPSHPTLVRRMLNRRLKQLVPTGPMLAASLMQVNKRCGQPWPGESLILTSPNDLAEFSFFCCAVATGGYFGPFSNRTVAWMPAPN